MPVIPFDRLPDDARLWVFAASDGLTGERANRLLSAVDEWLADWKAHGEPLTCARDWRDDRFLAIGVDQSAAGASGCSIDALFHVLKDLQGGLGTPLLASGRVFYRNRDGQVESTTRQEFAERASKGIVDADTIVFDTSLTSAAAYRTAFQRRAGDSWHRDLLPMPARM
jgi:hypothetical protein